MVKEWENWRGQHCPRCGDEFLIFPALSRRDNATSICSPCGVREAMFNFAHPGQLLPDLDQAIEGYDGLAGVTHPPTK